MNKKWFASDLAFKIYSLLIAIFLWVFVIYDQNPDSTKIIRNIPVTYSNLDSLERSGYTVLKEDDLSVDFVVKGKRISLGNLSKDSVRASVTFSDFREGEYNLSIDARLPENSMSVTDRSPATVRVKVEKLISKELPISIIYTGTNEQGKLASGELKTETVTVSGPESVLNLVKSAKVSLDYAQVSAAETGTADIHIYDSDGNDMTYDKNIRLSTDRTIWSQKIYNVKEAALEIVFAANEAYTMEELKISEDAVKLCSDGAKDIDIDKAPTLPISAEDAEKVKNGESITVVLDLPEHVNLLKQDEYGRWEIDETSSVKISGKVMHVEKIPLTLDDNLKITDKNGGKKYSLSELPEYIFIKTGDEDPAELWEAVFEISAKDLQNGEHKVKITAKLPENAEIMDEYTAKLTVSDN